MVLEERQISNSHDEEMYQNDILHCGNNVTMLRPNSHHKMWREVLTQFQQPKNINPYA